MEYDSRFIDACLNADLNDPATAEHLARVVVPNLESSLRLLRLCRSEPARREAGRIESALEAYRRRLPLEVAA